MFTANQIIQQDQIVAWKSSQRSDSFSNGESSSLIAGTINHHKCSPWIQLFLTRVTQGFIKNVARCRSIPQIFDRRYLLILLCAFEFIGFTLISATPIAHASSPASSVTFDSRPKLGVSFQLGNSLEVSSITTIKRSSFNALDKAFRATTLSADRLDSCTSLECYANVFLSEAGDRGVQEVLLISVESLDDGVDEAAVSLLSLSDGKLIRQWPEFSFKAESGYSQQINRIAVEVEEFFRARTRFGALQLENGRTGLQVVMDGKLVSTMSGTTLLVKGVPFGEHQLEVSGLELAPFAKKIQVSNEATAVVELPDFGRNQLFNRTAVVATGIVTTIIGAGIAAYAVTQDQQAPSALCLSTMQSKSDACGSGRPWATFTEPSSSNLSSSSVGVFPLGASLAVTGGGLITGGFLSSDNEWNHLITSAVSIALGIVTYVGLEQSDGLNVHEVR